MGLYCGVRAGKGRKEQGGSGGAGFSSGLAGRDSHCHFQLCHEWLGTGEEASGPDTGTGNGLHSLF